MCWQWEGGGEGKERARRASVRVRVAGRRLGHRARPFVGARPGPSGSLDQVSLSEGQGHGRVLTRAYRDGHAADRVSDSERPWGRARMQQSARRWNPPRPLTRPSRLWKSLNTTAVQSRLFWQVSSSTVTAERLVTGLGRETEDQWTESESELGIRVIPCTEDTQEAASLARGSWSSNVVCFE